MSGFALKTVLGDPISLPLHLVPPHQDKLSLVQLRRCRKHKQHEASLLPFLTPGSVVLDVGAHFGDTVLTLALRSKALGLRLRFFAFEPSEEKVEFIRQAVEDNALGDSVTVVRTAVGDSTGDVVLVENKKGSEYDGDRVFRLVGGGEESAAPMSTLDELASRFALGPVGLLHLDVEGWEARVLRGAVKLLSAGDGCTVIAETWDAREAKRRGLETVPGADIDEAVAALGGGFERQPDLVDQEVNRVYRRLPSNIPVAEVNGFTSGGGLGGNPAGVVVTQDATHVPVAARLAVAKSVGFSETVFVDAIEAAEGERELTIELNYYTPEARVEMCGHATIACLGHLREVGLLPAAVGGKIEGVLRLLCGAVRFRIEEGDDEQVFMQQLPLVQDTPLEGEVLERLLRCLGVEEEDVDFGSFGGPVVASTGLRDVQILLKEVGTLDGLRPDMDAMSELSKELDVVGVHVGVGVGVGVGGSRCKVRNFAPLFGIDEESATGTSNCALAGMLASAGCVGWGTAVLCEQGEGMGSPSSIVVGLGRDASEGAWVGGSSRTIGRGFVEGGVLANVL
jgi:PhzF family phenazine biosynthesis protein